MALALQSLLGVVLIPLAAYGMAGKKSRIDVRAAVRATAAGLGLMLAMALVLLKVPQAGFVFQFAAATVGALQRATDAGMQLVFGYLAGAPAPFEAARPDAGFILAFRGLPLILLVSALTRLLYHWGILQQVVGAFAVVFRRAFGIGGPLGTAASANIFLGMVEAPLMIRPYLATMGRGALFATMVTGMATVAGTVMALYALILEPVLPGAAGHVLTASLINAPAALLLSRLAVPEGFADETEARMTDPGVEAPRSSVDALIAGTLDGVHLLVAVVAMLVVATALVALSNAVLGAVAQPMGLALSVERIFGWLAAPVAYLIGIPRGEAVVAGGLIAKKLVLNELVAYIDLARSAPEALTPRSRLILTYALCGFANLGSLGIMIGGMTAMAPERRADIVELGPKSVLVGLMATLLSGAVIGTIVWQ